ncbi:hypothetical protein CRG98_041742 [Punica granatum]|uniref:NAC domain-containing protein n=1 Tax=Punica granatum TaxID=22663 RepID=A0A2I0I1N1_PUNGR|nr:hypothetical protein CRG98_041742 [Punica granatum]
MMADDEALSYYLRRKNLGLQEAECVVPEVDICRWEPQELPGKFRESSIVEPKDPEWWFFCEQEPGRTPRRSTSGGTPTKLPPMMAEFQQHFSSSADSTSTQFSLERDSIELDLPLSASEDGDVTDLWNEVLIDQDDQFGEFEMQTDDEALSYYLRRKNLGLQEAECVVPEVDICRWEPQELPGKFRGKLIIN